MSTNMPTNDTVPLEGHEAAMLRACESEIEKDLDGFLKVGHAFSVIRDSRLYRETHATWKAYLQERWQMSDRRARQFITASEVTEAIGTMVPVSANLESQAARLSVLPTNERQVRPLASLPEDEQREAWDESVKTAPRGPDGKPHVTGEHVKRTVEQRQQRAASAQASDEPLKPPPPLDDTPAAKEAAPQAAATVVDAITAVAAALNKDGFEGARDAAAVALGVLDKRWRGTSVENLTRSLRRLQEAVTRGAEQKKLALCVELFLRAVARGEA